MNSPYRTPGELVPQEPMAVAVSRVDGTMRSLLEAVYMQGFADGLKDAMDRQRSYSTEPEGEVPDGS